MRTIEAKAVISAADKTGNVFDKIASKFKGIEKNAKALSEIKAPKFVGDFNSELQRLKLSERELNSIRKSFGAFEQQLKAGPVRASHYLRAIDDWKSKTVNHWRDVKAGVEEADKAHQKFFKRVGHETRHAIAHTVGVAGVGYGAAHAFRETIQRSAERQREAVRYEQMGLTPDQLGEANDIADKISAKYPSLSRPEVLGYLRTNASRLGSFDRSKEVAETYARALISNKLSGGDDHELEQAVRAIEGSGKANSAGEFSQALNMWLKAKAANPDYKGEQFRSDLSAASSAKYGMSSDYMENVFPVLASHVSGFGNKLSTGLSALVGGRMTKQVKGELKKVGLLDKNGRLLDESGYISNNYEWTQKHIRPLLEKDLGINFGEEMTEADKGKTVDWLQHHFSARNAADLVATNLIDRPLVERARGRKTLDLDKMDELQKKDTELAWKGLGEQAKDAGAALMGLKTVTEGANAASNTLSRFSHWMRTGEQPSDSPYQRAKGTLDPDSAREWARRGSLQSQLTEADQKVSPAYGLTGDALGRWRLRQFDLQTGLRQSDDLASMPPIFSDKEREQWEEIDRERRRGVAFSALGGGAGSGIPIPRSRPSDLGSSGMPPVQPLDNAPQRVDVQGTVNGEAKLNVEVKASSYFEALVQRVENAIKLVGSLNTNGPGSNGKSSPDTGAPAVGP